MNAAVSLFNRAAFLSLICLMLLQITGEVIHEWVACGVFVWLCYHVWHARWWFSLLLHLAKSPRIRTLIAIDAAALAAVTTTLVTGLLISQVVVPFLRVESGLSSVLTVHVVSAYWSLLFVSMHIAVSCQGRLRKVQHRLSVSIRRILATAFGLWALYGGVQLHERSFVDHWFALTEYVFLDAEVSLFKHSFDFISIAVCFIVLQLLIFSRVFIERK